MKIMKKYRIVRDRHLGYEYECQVWRLWWPFWTQMGNMGYGTNTHRTIEEAKAFILDNKNIVWKS